MDDTIRTMQHELDTLLAEGLTLFNGTIQGGDSVHMLSFMKKHAPYQMWYAKSLQVIRQIYPELSDDFRAHYRALLSLSPAWYMKVLRVIRSLTALCSHQAKDPERHGKYGRRPWACATADAVCMGMAITPNGEAVPSTHMTFLARLSQQLRILHSVRDGLEYVLADMQGTLYGEVGDHVLATAQVLFRHGHHHAAGALAGVLLEIHLAKVAAKYRVPIRPEIPGITTLNAALKRGGIYSGEVWRFIQRLGALQDAFMEFPVRDLTADEFRTFLGGVQTVRNTVR